MQLTYDFAQWQVLSSDQFRQDLCGDWRDQSRNKEVFNALHDVAKARLSNGLQTVIDATHLRRKDRLASVALVPPGHSVTYIVIDRPMAAKILTGGWRNDLSFDLIRKHHDVFQQSLKDILAGDGLTNVKVIDLRQDH